MFILQFRFFFCFQENKYFNYLPYHFKGELSLELFRNDEYTREKETTLFPWSRQSLPVLGVLSAFTIISLLFPLVSTLPVYSSSLAFVLRHFHFVYIIVFLCTLKISFKANCVYVLFRFTSSNFHSIYFHNINTLFT